MKRLFKGQLSNEEFEAILAITGLRSKSVIKSLHNFYVEGRSASNSLYGGVTKGNFSKAKGSMEVAAEKKAKLMGEQ